MTRSPRTALLLALALAAAVSVPLEAARLPDWAQPIADAAPEVDDRPSKDPVRVLLAERHVTVDARGRMTERLRLATQALSARAPEVAGTGMFHFLRGATITRSRGWHVPPGEKATRKRGPPVDLTLDGSFQSDNRTRVLTVADVKKGSLIFFEFEATDTPVSLVYDELFFRGAPTDVARFELETPPGWSVRQAWLRRDGPAPVVAGDVRTWELRDLTAVDDEPLGDPPPALAPLLVVGLTPPVGTKVAPQVFRDWHALSLWYSRLGAGMDDPTADVRAAAQQALAGVGPGSFDRAAAATRFVRDRVRYLDREIGIGGYRPRPAAETLADLYGDCKDKGTLLRAMLAAGGLESYPLLVNLTTPETVSDAIPDLGAFDHFVVGVAMPPETAPARFQPALVDAGELGRLLALDPTDEFLSPGDLPTGLLGKSTLVVADERGRLLRLPEGEPGWHRTERTMELDLGDDGSLAVRLVLRHTGDPARAARRSWAASPNDRKRETQHAVLQQFPLATLGAYEVDAEDRDGAFVETQTLVAKLADLPGAGERLALFPEAAAALDNVSLRRRSGAVRYGYPRTIRFETLVRGVPTGTALPSSETAEGDGWAVRTSCERDRATVRATWELELTRTRFDPERFSELRKLWAAIARTAGAFLVPRPGSAAARATDPAGIN